MTQEPKYANYKEFLVAMKNTNTSDSEDSIIMQGFLRQAGFPSAVVTTGIVYLEGHGTMDAPPTSIHSVADMILRASG